MVIVKFVVNQNILAGSNNICTTVRDSVLKPACISSNFAIKMNYGQS